MPGITFTIVDVFAETKYAGNQLAVFRGPVPEALMQPIAQEMHYSETTFITAETQRNGGYDVRHYGLDVSYSPKSDRLRGVATIEATAKQGLSSFNLDLVGLTVRSVRVGGVRARWTRKGGELTIVPRAALRAGRRFRTVVAYDGVPASNGESGFIPTADGALIAGEPDVAGVGDNVGQAPGAVHLHGVLGVRRSR